MALSSQTLRPHSNRAHCCEAKQLKPGAALPKIAASIEIGIGSRRRLQCGGGAMKLSQTRAPGQARAALAERLHQTARPELPHPHPQQVSEFVQEQPETWSKEQRELVEATIDLGNLHVTPERRAEIVKQVRAAADKGFFFISNFGVDPELINDTRRVAKSFFAQPVEEKVKTKTDVMVRSRGVAYNAKFSAAKDGKIGDNPGYREEYRRVGDPEVNRWPPALPEFREVLDEYARQVEALVTFVEGLLAEGLGLPTTYIQDKYGKLLYDVLLYSSPPQQLKPGQIASNTLAAHSDPNMFNIAMYDGNRGVQFFRDGMWLTIPAILDRAIVNIGDDLETISNGIYHSAYHRVVTGPATRLSMIATVEILEDAMLEPAAELIDHQHPARYITRRRGDRLARIVNRFRQSLKPDRSKDGIVFNPDDVDKSKNIYTEGGEDYIGGTRVLDWDAT